MHKWYTQQPVNPSQPRDDLLAAQPEALPFETQSIDLILLPHVLENAYDPHQVLREVERVLVTEGRVIITGFITLSLWGMWVLIVGIVRLIGRAACWWR